MPTMRSSHHGKIGARQSFRSHSGFARSCLFATLLGMGMSSAIAAPIQLPPIVSPASQEHHVGKVIFVELITPDITGAKQFYSALFGWTYTDTNTGDTIYSQATLDGRPVAGIIQHTLSAGEHKQPAWLSFISVADVDVAKKTALAHGARVLRDVHSHPARGREAVFADPQGAVFAVLASSSGDPPDMLAEPGEWIWSSLITRDVDAGATFYQSLFDYEVFDLPSDDTKAAHVLLATDNFARASANTLPADKPNVHPHWLNFVRVDDAAKTAAKVVSLGGKVLVEPHPDRHGGNVAVVADPQGAPFGLLEWTESDGKEVTQ